MASVPWNWQLWVLPARCLHYHFLWLAEHSSHSLCPSGNISASGGGVPSPWHTAFLNSFPWKWPLAGRNNTRSISDPRSYTLWLHETGMPSHPGEAPSFIGCLNFLRYKSSPRQPWTSTSSQIFPLMSFSLEEGRGSTLHSSLGWGGSGNLSTGFSRKSLQNHIFIVVVFKINPPCQWGFNGHPTDFWLSTLKYCIWPSISLEHSICCILVPQNCWTSCPVTLMIINVLLCRKLY